MRTVVQYALLRGRPVLHAAIALLLAILAMRGGPGGAAPPSIPPGGVRAPLPVAADPQDRRVLYRVVTVAIGEVVERSGDGGHSWTILLTPAPSPAGVGVPSPARGLASPTCLPARYAHVRVLLPVHGPAARLLVATAGTPGYYLDRGCSSSVGGLFVVGTGGRASALGTAGLSFAQDPVERTIRAYDVDAVVVDPLQPATIYVHAGHGTGPGSPPAGLFRSDDAGAHWQPIDGGLVPSAAITNSAGQAVPIYGAGVLALIPGVPRALTFRNDTGAYTSAGGGRHWRRIGTPAAAPPTPTPAPDPPTPATTQAALPPRLSAPHSSLIRSVSLCLCGEPTPTVRPSPCAPPICMGTPDRSRRLCHPAAVGGCDGAYVHIRDVQAAIPWPAGWAWSRIDPIGATPPARQDAAVAWDPAANRLLVFGGKTGDAPRRTTNDLWSFTLTDGGTTGRWTPLFAADPGCTIACPSPPRPSRPRGGSPAGCGTMRTGAFCSSGAACSAA